MLRGQRNDDRGEFAALRFVDRDGVGELQFVEFAWFVMDPLMPVKSDVY